MNADKKLIDEMIKYFVKCKNVEKAVLFGSRARGDNTERSDYDIAVYGDLSRREMAVLRTEFDEDLPTLHKIDLIFMCVQAESDFTANIEKEGKIIYEKIETKPINFTHAVKLLREAITAYKENKENTLYRDAVIQRFEFTFELAWHTIDEALREQGIVVETHSPKAVFKSAYAAGIIENEADWIEILVARNNASHIYDEDAATGIAADICNSYGRELSLLQKKLSQF